jgi:hypothetical protein
LPDAVTLVAPTEPAERTGEPAQPRPEASIEVIEVTDPERFTE